jgi:polyphosphate glucokinase
MLRALTHFDHLYIGGGNAPKLRFDPDPDVTLISNEAGIRGGIALWRAGAVRTDACKRRAGA